MSETDEIVTVRECHDALRVDLWHREDMLQDVTDAVTKTGAKVIKDQVGEGFANRVDLVLEIVAEDYVVEAEVSGWTIRHMADDQTIRLTSRLMHHDQVSEFVGLADLNQVFEHVATSIHTSCVRDNQLEFFLEGHQSLTRVTTRCDQKLWVCELGVLILIINV